MILALLLLLAICMTPSAEAQRGGDVYQVIGSADQLAIGKCSAGFSDGLCPADRYICESKNRLWLCNVPHTWEQIEDVVVLEEVLVAHRPIMQTQPTDCGDDCDEKWRLPASLAVLAAFIVGLIIGKT